MTSKLPLSGMRIAVTRPQHQAASLAGRIEQAGGTALLFPLLDIAALDDTGALHEQISRLAEFDLAIFVSPNAVHYGWPAIQQAGKFPANVRIAAIGQGSAKALREAGVANVIAPTGRYDSEALLSVPELQNVSGWRVLILRGESGRELLGDTLGARSATVEYAACYRRSKTVQDAGLLLSGAPDAISVTSSEALENLWQISSSEVRSRLRQIPLYVPHPRIAELAMRQGWLHVRQTKAGDDGLLEALLADAEGKDSK